PTDTYTLSLHDALPILPAGSHRQGDAVQRVGCHTERLRRQTNASMCTSIAAPPKKVQPSIFCESRVRPDVHGAGVTVCEVIQRTDRKSTRLNSSHVAIS